MTTGYLDARYSVDANMDRHHRNLAQLQLLLLEMERQLLIISAMIERVRSRWGLPVIRQTRHRRYRFRPWLTHADREEDGQYPRLMPRLQLDDPTETSSGCLMDLIEHNLWSQVNGQLLMVTQ